MAKEVAISEDQFKYVIENANVFYYMMRDNLARDSGVPRNTINKILQGVTTDPSVNTIRKLYLAIKRKEKSQKGKSRMNQVQQVHVDMNHVVAVA